MSQAEAALSHFWNKLGRFLPLTETLPVPFVPPPPRVEPLEDALGQSLQQRFPGDLLRLDTETLCAYCASHDYPGFVRRMSGATAPQAVLYPSSEQDLADMLLWAAEREIGLWNWGSGQAMPDPTQLEGTPYMVTDLARMNRVLEFNESKQRIRVQAGLRWAELRAWLMEKDLATGLAFMDDTVSVGAALAHGMFNLNALGYGGLRANVYALRGMTPAGPLQLERSLPGAADLRGLLLGAQQHFGILTETTLRLRPLPTESSYLLVSFPSWDKAITALRRLLTLDGGLLRAGILSADELTLFSTEPPVSWMQNLRSRLSNPTPKIAYLMLELTVPKDAVAKKRQQIEALLKEGEEPLETNNKVNAIQGHILSNRRVLLPHLWRYNVLAHTVTAAAPWTEIAAFRRDWEEALQSIIQATGETRGLTLTTLHATLDEAVLHTLVLGLQSPEHALSREEQVQAIEAVAQETQRRWSINTATPTLLTQALQAVSETLDPQGVLLG